MYDTRRFRRVIEYLWDAGLQLTDFENDIICLGERYSPVMPESQNVTADRPPPQSSGHSQEWPADFLADVEARIWMSYRTNFPSIPRAKGGPSTLSFSGLFGGSKLDLNGFTSDVGWGCMIRTSQSLLANCFSTLKLGREWRRPQDGSIDTKEAEILFSFLDNNDAPFSLHNYVRHGHEVCGKLPGEWFGPSAAASSIESLQSSFSQDLNIYVSSGSDVYEKEFYRAATKGGEFKPTLILLGLRLGIDTVNKVYWDSLKQFLSCPQALGIAGGRPSSSHYFIGYQGDYLFYLDPHYPRPALNAMSPQDLTSDDIASFHTNRIRWLPLNEMDPSMLVGILIKNETDWKAWKNSILNSSATRIIQILPEPVALRRVSLSAGSDEEDDGFVDISFAPAVGIAKGEECESESPVDSRAQSGADTEIKSHDVEQEISGGL